ncbi:DDE-type integrase/transposase/recombinase [Campylobacter sp. faydin G-140]|uniref:Mu transposase C-terminal domain-containing protein n=1 Tax=Campylobacter anatolicus TaxID=2829105 RepID=UPI001B9606C0|nr:Mu transposase C-terminal domain-containing protein [Campylobacter anatolicus]MBR8466359.1 DDE-type integrase/transposase/recombinase [Campylobacter anatolicus]
MWVNSKEAAEILGVKYDALQKATRRSEKSGKKFCSIKFHKLYFEYIDGRGGASGKILQIWLDDNIVNNTKGKSDENSSDRANPSKGFNKVNANAREKGAGTNAGVHKEYAEQRVSNSCNANGCVWLESKESVDGCFVYNLHDNHSISSNILIDKKANRQSSVNESDKTDICNFVTSADNFNNSSCPMDYKWSLQNEEVSDKSIVEKVYECEAVDNSNKLPLIATCSDKKRKAAFEKYNVIKEWENAKGKIKEADFIEYINSKNICSIKLTSNKLYDWQRKYKNGGLDALVDERTNNKTLMLEALGLKDYAIKLIHAQQGRINVTNIYNLLNYEAIKSGQFNLEAFNGKKDEIVSYEVVYRFVKNYLNKNKLLKNIILYGEDGAISRGLPSLGISNWAVDSINQIVEIDASPLDLICNASDICDMIGFNAVNNIFKDKDEFETYVKEWQKRYTIIALIDTYSGVATFHISDTENSVGIARAVAKYILRYGKPAVIKGDNGKAFKSEHISSVMSALEIEYRAVRAYSGWLKPYVERNFRALQHNFTANLAGFIGHNITQRQAIEFFYSKKERRLKKGYKTNLRELKNLQQVQSLMDMYSEKFLNTRYLERLEMSVCEAYNQKAHEAVAMDAISLSARLSKRELKSVNKKGVSVDNLYYQSPDLFNYERVWVNKNIDNNHECFVWDNENNFIGVAVVLDDKVGVSVEVAKAGAKLFNKRLKETKEAKTIATNEIREDFINFIENIEVKEAIKPSVKAVNSESRLIGIANQKAKSVIKNEALSDEILNVAGSDIKKCKKHKGWEHFGVK